MFAKPKRLGTFRFVHPKDPAIDPSSDLDGYRESWDFDATCKLRDGEAPTYFHVNFDLPYRKVLEIENAVVSAGAKGRLNVTVASQVHQAVKAFLTDIENPADAKEEGLQFKSHGGLAADEVISDLHTLGLIDDLYQFWSDRKSEEKTELALAKKS